MDITAESLPNPLYHPLPPSIEGLVTYADEVEDEAKHLTPEWAINEINNHLTGFVRVGLVADIVCRYRHYKRVTKTWAAFCQNILGLSQWYIRRMINAAKAVLALARHGFKILPKNEAQARALTKFEGDELIEKWQTVIDRVPAHRMTASAIAEALEEDSPKPMQANLKIDPQLYRRLLERAVEEGVTVNDLLEQMLDGGEETDEVREQPEEEIREQNCANLANFWLDDLQNLVAQYEQGEDCYANLDEDRTAAIVGGNPHHSART